MVTVTWYSSNSLAGESGGNQASERLVGFDRVVVRFFGEPGTETRT
jgi:hypothetical protein